jgi:Ca-activated chloride channel family protein
MKKIIKSMLALTIVIVLLTGCGSAPPSNDAPYDGADDGYYEPAPAPGYVDDYSYDGEKYLDIPEGGLHYTDDEQKITFSLKVDTAAYTNVKRYVGDGFFPPEDAVRTEELINYFNYDEPLAFDGESPFAVYTEIGPSPFDAEKQMAFIRVKTADVDVSELPPSNLVFLIDTSGSMDSYDKLPLLQDAFSMLTDTLDEDDIVSIVTYAGNSRVVLRGARGDEKNWLNDAIYDLAAGGSTAGEEGIQTAYALAEDYFIEGGNNRVILATDGDFNVGLSGTDELADFIGAKRDTGIYLSVLGFGTGNIRDDIMETLSKEGNGNYSYIDTWRTAQKVLVSELGTNIFTVADDVKAQVVFNPETVKSYRLIGYENRMLNNEDFSDDTKDAGEIGAGSDVVAMFELDITDADSTLFDVRIRYKNPGDSESKLLTVAADRDSITEYNTTDFGFACSVALFGDMLRHPDDISRRQISTLFEMAGDNIGEDSEGYRNNFLNLLNEFSNII